MRRPGDYLKADGVTIDAKVECGAVGNLRWVKGLYSGPLVCFEAPKDGSPQGMWWRFRVRGAGGRKLWFHLTNVPEVLGGGGLGEAVPVMREGRGAWRRVDPETCQKLGPRGPFEFAVDFQTSRAEVAWCYPYGPSDLAAFLKALPASKRKRLRAKRIGTSAEGRALKMISVAEGRKPAVWLTARNHAGEVAGSHAIEGALGALAGGGPAASWLRRNCVIHAVPFVDLDSVAEGRYGKNHRPRDPNRDWSARPIRPEPAAVIKAIEASRRAERPALFIDLHCPGAGEPRSYPVMPNPTAVDDAGWSRHAALARAVERAAPRDFPVRLRDWSTRTVDWATWPSAGVANSFARNAGMTALTLELTYNRTARGNLATAELYRALGRSLLGALAAFLKREKLPKAKKPRVPAARGWETVNLPKKARLWSGGGGAARFSGRGEGSRVLVKKLAALPAGRGRRAGFTLEATVKGTRRIPVKAVILPETADGHWTGQVIEKRVSLARGRTRRHLSAKMKSPARAFRVGLEVVDFSGTATVAII